MTILTQMFRIRAILFLLILTSGSFASNTMENEGAWEMLLNNKYEEAKNSFIKNVKSKDKKISGEAYRGLAHWGAIKGIGDSAAMFLSKSYDVEKNIENFTSNYFPLIQWRSTVYPRFNKEILKTLNTVVKKPGLFQGTFLDLMITKYIKQGNLKKANSLSEKMGVIKDWHFIGPFDNVGNSGYFNSFPPETEIDLSKEYVGKNGNTVKWMPIHNSSPSSWIFLENHSVEYNSINYFYSQIKSPKDQELIISLGASASFKIFLNGNSVLQDSIFRNTGADMFMAKANFKKGVNHLLVKLGHEGAGGGSSSGKSNFALRVIGTDYKPVKKLKVSNGEKSKPLKLKSVQNSKVKFSTPLYDSLLLVMESRINKNSKDYDAILSLIQMYNHSEQTQKADVYIQKLLKKFPKSSYLYSILSENKLREKKYTQSEIYISKAYELSPDHYYPWSQQMELKSSSGNAEAILKFIEKSPKEFQKNTLSLLGKIGVYSIQGKQAKIFEVITEIENGSKKDLFTMEVLYNVYIAKGEVDKAIALIEDYLQYNRNSESMGKKLVDIYLKQGKIPKAEEVLKQSAKYSPLKPNAYYFLSLLSYNQKKYDKALKYINQCLTVIPNSHNSLNLKGNILSSMGRKKGAIETFHQSVKFTSDDFTAWEGIRSLTDKKSFEEMAPLPNVDSLIKSSKDWREKLKSSAGLVSFSEDVFYYPSHSSRTRTFFVLHLPNQKEIDEWKEYNIGYNSSYQSLKVTQAISRKKDGSIVQADKNRNQLVFKSLEPGDFMVLEYDLYNYYQGEMAGNIYGEQSFKTSLPAYSMELRLINPKKDTIPYQVFGKGVKTSHENIEDYRITKFSIDPYGAEVRKKFIPTDFNTNPKVIYSTFKSWESISNWYYSLTTYKKSRTSELKALADSLFTGAKDDMDKVRRVYEYMAKNITYSYVSFRQSGWVPQSSSDVLATKIGDCKDMSLLAKSLLEYGGVKSYLTLVNSDERYFNKNAYVGPNFNHCILAYVLKDKTYYVDLTSKYSAVESIPSSIQGTLALLVKPGSKDAFNLPTDSPLDRIKQREVTIKISEDKSILKTVKTKRTGMYASQFRYWYQFDSKEEREKGMKDAISDTYADFDLTKFDIKNLDTLGKEIDYVYDIKARDAVVVSGKTAIFNVEISDKLESDEVPKSGERKIPYDMARADYDISQMNSSTFIEYPKKWKILSYPENVKLKTKNMNYHLSISESKGKITIDRMASFNFNRQFSPKEFQEDIAKLKKVVASDNIQILFTVK